MNLRSSYLFQGIEHLYFDLCKIETESAQDWRLPSKMEVIYIVFASQEIFPNLSNTEQKHVFILLQFQL